MNKIRIFLCLCLVNTTFAQKSVNVGFYCGEELSYPKIAEQYESLIKTQNYNKIVKGLYSKNVAENYFSVIVSEKLESLGKIVLSKKDSEVILKIRNSSRKVNVCEGCGVSEKTLKETFEALKSSAEFWLQQYF